MDESFAVERFRCPACGRQFAWKEELAGRKVTCKCGRIFVATRVTPVTPVTPMKSATTDDADDGSLDLYPDDAPKPVGTVLHRPARADEESDSKTTRPTATRSSAALAAYPGSGRRVVVQDAGGDVPSPWKDAYVPIILGALGLVGWGVLLGAFPFRGVEPGKVLVMAGVMLGVNLAAVLLTLYVTAALLGVNFGAPRAAVAKVAGMSLLASAIFIGAVRLDYPDVRGAIAGFHVVIFFYWGAFASLFDLELQETVITVTLVALVQAMAGCVVLKV